MALLGRPTSRWTGARFPPSMLSHYFVFATWIVIWISMGMAVDADCGEFAPFPSVIVFAVGWAGCFGEQAFAAQGR